MNIIDAKNIQLKYLGATATAIDNVDFAIEEGQITLFLGKSGSGKTSLLKCLANIITDYTGELTFRGKAIRALTRKERAQSIGYVAQQFNLFPHMTALDNCVHPQIAALNRVPKAALEHAKKMFTHLDIEGLEDRKPKALSGGQQQRVAIARALCMNSKILLLDEPTSALDPESSEQLRQLLQTLIDDKITIVISTHDMSFAQRLYDRVYLMEQGRIVEVFEKGEAAIPLKIAQYFGT